MLRAGWGRSGGHPGVSSGHPSRRPGDRPRCRPDPGPLPAGAQGRPANDLALSCIEQLSRWKRTIRRVVRYNCYVNLSADDAELVQLLGQLLRVVSPESAGPGHGGSGLGNGGPRPGGGQARPDGVAGDGPAIPDPGRRDRPAGAAAEPSIPALSASEARALIELVAARGIAQGQLGTLLGLEKSTVSRWRPAWSARAGSGAAGTRRTSATSGSISPPRAAGSQRGSGARGRRGRPGSSPRSPSRSAPGWPRDCAA